MIGSVYVFNSTPNNMLLLLNNHVLAPALNGIQKTSNYAPQQVTAPRNSSSGDPGNSTFGGKNTLVVSFSDGTSQTYPIKIDPSQIQINNDLQLYIFFNVVILVLPDGTAGQQVIQGTATTSGIQELIDAQRKGQ